MLEKFKNKVKIAVNSRLFTRFSKLPLFGSSFLLRPTSCIYAGDEVIKVLKRMDTKYEWIKVPLYSDTPAMLVQANIIFTIKE